MFVINCLLCMIIYIACFTIECYYFCPNYNNNQTYTV